MILVIAIVLGFIYGCFIAYHLIYWAEHDNKTGVIHKDVSIVIVARNEAHNINSVLQSIADNNYPSEHYEIILVDDHSTDDTPAVANAMGLSNLSIISLEGKDLSRFGSAYKKAGQYYGIQTAKHPLILTTDADCICKREWIQSMVGGLDEADIATGTIDIIGENSLLCLLQRYDNIATMMTTAVGIDQGLWYSANAANMIFKKKLYQAYQKEMKTKYASGDDVMLLQWSVLNNHKANFVNTATATITTAGERTWKGFIRQRLRWASKSGGYLHQGLNYIWSFIFLCDLMLLISLVLMITNIYYWPSFMILLVAKSLFDGLMLRRGGYHFGYSYPVLLAPILSLLHAGYVLIIGVLSLLRGVYTWKDRRVT